MTIHQMPRYPVTIDDETAQIGTASELAIALDVLQGQHDRAVLQQLEPHLADIIASPSGLMLVMRSLSPEDQLLLVGALGPRLAGIVRDASHLGDLLATLAHEEVERGLLDTLGPTGLRALILTAGDLSQVLEWVYGQCDREVIELLGADYVRSIAKNGHDLALALNSLDHDMQSTLLALIGWDRIAQLVVDGRDLAYLMAALPPELSVPLIQRYSQQQLAELIGNAADWEYLWKRLEPVEAEALEQKLGVAHHAQ
jgi:hypothetical protein